MHGSSTSARTAALVFLAAIVVANCAGGGGCDANGCAQGCEGSSGCGGGGCTIEPIPGGFPRAEEVPAGVQVRVSQSGLAFLENNVDPLIKQVLPTGLDFEVPPTCDQDAVIGKIHICADKQGNSCVASAPPCKVSAAIAGVKITPDATKQNVLKVAARLSAKTPTGAPLRTSGLVACKIALDTAAAGKTDAGFELDVRFDMDATTKRTSIVVENAEMTDLDSGDIQVSGGFLCSLVDLPFIKTFLVRMVREQVGGMVKDMVDSQLCTSCAQNPCPSGATCDPSTKVCMLGQRCLQGLGMEGRVPLTMIPGAQGKLDFMSWLGGSVQMPAGGVTLGMLGGSAPEKPAGCVKPRPDLKPDLTTPIPVAQLLKGNVDPDGKPYDIGIAVHKRLLDQGGWAAYTAGGLCINVDSSLSELLSTGTFALIMPSVNILTGGQSAPVQLSIVPSRPPEMLIGKGVVEDDGKGNLTLKQPLITLRMKDLGIQMYVLADERYVRILELTADLEVPVALHLANGEIQPVIGDLKKALSNLRVSGSQLLGETPETLETKFPVVLNLALGMLPDLINQTIALPSMMGIEIKSPKFVGIENNTMLGIFAQLGTAPQSTSLETPGWLYDNAPAETEAKLVEVLMPQDPEVMRLGRRADLDRGPRLRVAVPTRDADGRELEYAWRLDGTSWSGFARGPELEIRSTLLFLLGRHDLELRARVLGRPNTTDVTPRRLSVMIRSPFDNEVALPADEASGGCAVGSSSETPAAGGLLLILGALLLAARRRGVVSLLCALTLVLSSGCSDSPPAGTDSDGSTDTMVPDQGPTDGPGPKVLKRGMTGRHSALVASGDTLYASAYEQGFGDLVLISAPLTSPDQLSYEVVDGAPDGPVTHDPNSYRGGVSSKGDDVGLGTDIALTSAGAPQISYYDKTNKALRFAGRQSDGWSVHQVEAPTASSEEIVGRYTALAMVDGKPAIAYTVQNIAKGNGTFTGELRLALAKSASPAAASDWTISVVDSGPSPCTGLCATGEECFVTQTGSVCKKPATGCGKCEDGTACLAGKCEPVLAKSTLSDVPKTMGIWPALVAAPGGSVLAVYHDSARGTLRAARLASASATTWTKKTVAQSSEGDLVGAYPAAATDASGLHVVFQNVTRGTLHYAQLDPTTLNEKSKAVVDDGLRPDGRHPVGADAAAVIDASGGLRVMYQDQQTSDLLLVSRTQAGAWTPTTASDANLGRLLKGGDKGYGFYADLIAAGGSLYGSSFVFEAGAIPPGFFEFFKLP